MPATVEPISWRRARCSRAEDSTAIRRSCSPAISLPASTIDVRTRLSEVPVSKAVPTIDVASVTALPV